MREWLGRALDWFRRGRLERELSEELRFHRERLAEDALARGASPAEAARLARRQLGDDVRTREATRARWSLPWLDVVLQDARYALRGLRRAPAFTALVVLTLGLGIGANAAMFGVIDRLMFRPLSNLREADSVSRVYLQWDDERGRRSTWTSMPYRRYVDLLGWTRSFSNAAAFSERSLAVGEGEWARDRRVGAVSASFFDFFDVAPHAGRFFEADEDVPPGGPHVAVLSWAFWQTQFGGVDVIGRTIPVGNVVTTIIGVAPPRFRGVGDADPPVLFIPIASQAAAYGHADPASYYTSYDLLATDVLVRRRAGVDEAAASADLTQAFRRSWEAEQATRRNPTTPESARPVAIASSVRPAAGPDPAHAARTGVRVSAVAVIVLLIACANAANLMLGRALKLRRETSVRMALGAGRARLLMPMLVEAVILAGCAALLGLLAAQWGGAAIQRLLVPQTVVPFETWSDGRTVRVTAVLSLIVACVVALAPLLLHGSDRVGDVLRGAGRGIVAGRSRLRSALLVVQAALSVALLIGAILFVRSLERLRAVPLGYDAESVLLVRPTVRGSAQAGGDRAPLREALLARARTLPGVSAASWTTFAPLTMSAAVRLHVPGIDSVNALGQFTQQHVAARYFEAAGTRILAGRAITDADHASAPPVAVISRSMARTLWPGEAALGKCIHIGPETAPCTSVVGIAEDIADSGPADASRLHFYLPWDQAVPRLPPPMRAMLEGSAPLVLRMRAGAGNEAETVRRALQPLMPAGGWISVQGMSDLVDRSMQGWQLGATLFSGFGALALITAAVGLYGVIAYEAAQRRPELGIRTALGAQRSALIWLVLRRSTFFALAGVVLGTAVAFAAGPWLEPLLFQQSARDPVVYAAVALLMGAIALAAGAAPAARAAASDPNQALRCE